MAAASVRSCSRGSAPDSLHGDVARASVEVSLHACAHARGVSPRDELVDEPVAAFAGEVSFVEALAQPARAVVLEPEVRVEMRSRDSSRTCGIRLEHEGLLGCQELVVAELPTRSRRVSLRHQIGMRAVGTVSRQREHLRPESADHAWDAGGRSIELVEVAAHRIQRPAVLQPERLDERRMADAEAEHEPVVVRLSERPAPVAAATGVLAQMLAMPLATETRSVTPSRSAACTSASREVGLSPNHRAP